VLFTATVVGVLDVPNDFDVAFAIFLLAMFMLIVLVLLCSHLKSADSPYNIALICKY